MSLKPDVVPQEQVIEEVKGMTEQRLKLFTQINDIETKHKLIEASLAENDHIKERVKALLAESLSLFEEEWKTENRILPGHLACRFRANGHSD